MNSDNNMKSSIIKYRDNPILRKELSNDELKYAVIMCERHNSLSPNDKGEYKCGCHNADKSGGGNVLCNAGLWLESCTETFDFIEYIKGKFKYDGILVINNRIKEEDLEEFLLAGGWDVYDNEDDIENRVIDSCKVCDIAHDYGFAVEDPVSESGAVFIKEGENMGVCYEVYAEVRYEGKWNSLSPLDKERGSKDWPEAERLFKGYLGSRTALLYTSAGRTEIESGGCHFIYKLDGEVYDPDKQTCAEFEQLEVSREIWNIICRPDNPNKLYLLSLTVSDLDDWKNCEKDNREFDGFDLTDTLDSKAVQAIISEIISRVEKFRIEREIMKLHVSEIRVLTVLV